MQTFKATRVRIELAADLHKWRTFLAIAELGSLTKAALFLDSNQSLLSRQLNAMERDCGARLFNRTGRGVELSELGARLLPCVRTLLGSAERLEQEILGEAQAPAGNVTVATLPSIGHHLVGQLFRNMREHAPSVHLKILEGSSGQVEEWLTDARVDIAILYRYGTTLPEGEQCLATVDSYLIGARGDALTAVAELPFASLDGLPFILPSAPNGLRNALDAMARQQRIVLEPVIEADSLPLMRTLVARDRLFTVLPLHAAWQEVEEGLLQASRIADPPMQRMIALALSKSKGPPSAVRMVVRQIESIVDDMARQGMWHPRTL